MKGAAILLAFLLCISMPALANNEVKLKVRNDYSFDIILNVKCGKWTGKRFEYERRFRFPEGKTTLLLVPKNFDECQIWPSHNW